MLQRQLIFLPDGSTRPLSFFCDVQVVLPSGYSIAFGGTYSEQQQSFHELAMILSLATLLVLTVLMFLLREWLISLAVLFISLTGICGCLLALWLTGVPLNVSSYTGIIMIVGILAENSIFTVWQYRMNRRRGGAVDEHRCHPCPDAPRLGAGHGRTDAAAACRGGDRRFRRRAAPAAGGASGADAEDIPVNELWGLVLAKLPFLLYLCLHIATLKIKLT